MTQLLIGHLSTWILLAAGWLLISIVSAMIFGLIARMGREDGGK